MPLGNTPREHPLKRPKFIYQQENAMSVEFGPVTTIPFHYIDERLEKYGIKVERYGYRTALIGRNGTLFVTPEGESTHFENKFVDTDDVLDAIRAEYQVEIVDEEDRRFWGYSTWDEAYSTQ
jgi:hypothetical protein